MVATKGNEFVKEEIGGEENEQDSHVRVNNFYLGVDCLFNGA